MFSEAVLDHFQNPRNAGGLPNADAAVEVTNPVCGDILKLALRREDILERHVAQEADVAEIEFCRVDELLRM